MALDKSTQIQKRKELLDRSAASVHQFEQLLRDCEGAEKRGSEIDIFAVRAVSQIEVFTRHWVRVIVDHSHQYATRAIPLIQTSKPNYELVLSASQDLITFGDVVAHTISVSNFTHVVSVFESLCECKLEGCLPGIVDRWEVEVNRRESKPIISNYTKVCADLAALFETRHVICHEAPNYQKLDLSKLVEQLRSLSEFSSALNWHVIYILHGKIPLTQTDMNITAIRKYEKANEELNVVLNLLRQKVSTNERELKLLNTTQAAWERFRSLQSCFRHDPQGGGTIGPMLRSAEAEELTRERLEHLRWYQTRAEYDR